MIIKDLYDFDSHDQAYIIKMAPDYYLDIFNNLDHYPLRKRDINQQVINYIEDCSSDIPLTESIEIEIKIKKQLRNNELEERTRTGIHNYFSYILTFYRAKSRSVINTSIIYIIIFLILTTFTFTLDSFDIQINKIFLKTILEGLSIGSWVFLWEAIAGLVIKNKENRYMIRTYKRLSQSFLYFLYN